MLGYQLRRHFDDSNIVIELIHDAKDAVSIIETNVKNNILPILGIVDYQMPDVNGAQLIRKSKEKFPEMKFIMISGESNQQQIKDLFEDNLLEHYIDKPWEEVDLINSVKSYV
jgi:YesN/AraC family two-component response regulator